MPDFYGSIEQATTQGSNLFYGSIEQATTNEVTVKDSSAFPRGVAKATTGNVIRVRNSSASPEGAGRAQANGDRIKGAIISVTGTGKARATAEAEMNASSYAKGAGKQTWRALVLSVPEGAYVIDADNYRSKNQPANSDEMANKIIVETQPLRPTEEDEEVYDKEITLAAGEGKSLTASFDEEPVIDALAFLRNSEVDTEITEVEYYAWGADIVIENNSGQEDTFELIVEAKPLEVRGKQKVTAKDEESIREHEEIKYELEENHLIQTEELAQQIVDTVLDSAVDPRRDVELDWRGNPALILADLISVPEFNDFGNFYVVRQNIEYDGALTADTEGRKI